MPQPQLRPAAESLVPLKIPRRGQAGFGEFSGDFFPLDGYPSIEGWTQNLALPTRRPVGES